MAALRQPQPEFEPPERPALRLVEAAGASGALPATLPEAALSREAFSNGLRWGIVVSSLGFWLPVAAALYAWLS